jgi:hypothetical protein
VLKRTMEFSEVRQFVDNHTWFHSIDLGNGIITPGSKSQAILWPESEAVFSPVGPLTHMCESTAQTGFAPRLTASTV